MTKNTPSNERGKLPSETPSTAGPEKSTPTPAPAYDDISSPPPNNDDMFDAAVNMDGVEHDGPRSHHRLPHRGPPRGPPRPHHEHDHHPHHHDGMPPPPPPPPPPCPPPYPERGFDMGMPPRPPHMGGCPMFDMMGFGDPRMGMGMGMGMGPFGRMHGRGRGGPRGGGGRGGRGGFGAHHHHHGHGGLHAPPHAHGHHGGFRGGRHRAWRGMPWMWGAAPWMSGSPWDAHETARDDVKNDNNNENDNAERTLADDEDDIIDFVPVLDTFDQPAQYTLMFELPGAKRSDVAVTWDDAARSLRVSGVVYRPGDEAFLQTLAAEERAVGVFERVARLDDPVKAEEIVARLEDGVLRVDVPKDEEGTEKAKARTVEVL